MNWPLSPGTVPVPVNEPARDSCCGLSRTRHKEFGALLGYFQIALAFVCHIGNSYFALSLKRGRSLPRDEMR